MKPLWAPWRSDYVNKFGKTDKESPDEKECVFCSAIKTKEDHERFIIHRGENAFVILNLYPYSNGHLLVIPYLHVCDLNALDNKTHHEIMDLIVKGQDVLKQVYHPQGINIGANIGAAAGAGIDQHLHFHILPRWLADVNFMTAVGNTRVIPESLEETWEKIRSAW